jgi:hypothetical protein
MTNLELTEAQRVRLAELADQLMPAGAGLPSASEADVHGKWIDRALIARPDLESAILGVLAVAEDPNFQVITLKDSDYDLFDRFSYTMAGCYFMNPKVRKSLGLPGNAPKPNPPLPDESDYYLRDGILDPVLKRGPIYRPTP